MGLHDYGHVNAPQRILHHTTYKRICKCLCVRVQIYIAYVDAEGSWMKRIHLNNEFYVHNEAQTHVQWMYLPHVNDVRHSTTHRGAKWQNTGVTCPLYVICYTNVDFHQPISRNALAYDFNLLSLQRTFLCSSWRHWLCNQLNLLQFTLPTFAFA